MKKYTFYEWCADDEGGTGVCLTDEYQPNLGGYNDFQEALEEAEELCDRITF